MPAAEERVVNDAPDLDADIGAASAPARVFVVRAREDLEIARQVRAMLTGTARYAEGD